MKFHEFADLFPMMKQDEYEQLVADIKENGLLEPIVTYEGKILDGRNRWLACGEANVEPRFEEYIGDQPVSYVVSKNIKRRHLNGSQKAMIATEIKPALEEEARQRQAHGMTAPGKTLSEQVHEPITKGRSDDKAGEVMGVSGRYVSEAEKIKHEAPEYVKPIMDGKMTITQAKREITHKQRAEASPLPSDKYRVIYADPPWKYNDTRSGGNDDFMNQYPAAETHYPTMTITELCNLPISDLCENNSVLFLWVTSPLLEDSFKIIKAWGFSYKTSFIWDKIKHNMGHYNSVRHELLLICTRGSCTPDNKKLFDSVQSIDRSDIHSQKPEEFREIIETLYTHGKKLELFARSEHEGWEVWGNEPKIN
jgi:N6-adenosine-specific RNA methylase IME4